MFYKKKEYTYNDGFFIDGVSVKPSGWARVSGNIQKVLIVYENGITRDVFTVSGIILTIEKANFLFYVDLDLKVGDWIKFKKIAPDGFAESGMTHWDNDEYKRVLGKTLQINNVRENEGYVSVKCDGRGTAESIVLIERKLTPKEVEKIHIKNLIKEIEKRRELLTGDYVKKAQEHLQNYVLFQRKVEFAIAKTSTKKEVEKFMLNFSLGMERIKKHKGVKTILNFNFSNVEIETDHLFIEHGKPEFVGMYSGKFIIKIDLLNSKVSVLAHETMPWSSAIHPHCNSSGEMCWGNMKEGVAEAFKEFDIYGVFLHTIESLLGVTGSTYFELPDRNLINRSKLDVILKDIKIDYEWEEENFGSSDCDSCGCDLSGCWDSNCGCDCSACRCSES